MHLLRTVRHVEVLRPILTEIPLIRHSDMLNAQLIAMDFKLRSDLKMTATTIERNIRFNHVPIRSFKA